MMSAPWFPAQPVRLEQVVRNARFAVYGLAESPDDLMLHGVGYSTVAAGWGNTTPSSAPPPIDGPQYLWQVDLNYSSPPVNGAWMERLEVHTTALAQSPVEAPDIEQLRQTYVSHYHSDDEVPTLDSQRSVLIDHFELVDQDAMAAVSYFPDPKSKSLPHGVLIGWQKHELTESVNGVPIHVPASPPTWSFTFRASDMWVDVQAFGWPQQDIFAVLHLLAPLNNRPDVVARSQHEVTRWEQAIGWRRSE